jgi:uncharacterized protein (DUF952 family)
MILHLVSKADWEAAPADQPYRAASLEREGFIHATGGEALMLDVANAFYKDQPGEFLLLHIDESKLSSEVKWEAPVPLGRGAEVPSSSGEKSAQGTDRPPEVKAEFGDSALNQTPQPPTPSAPLFPHIYGPINRDAIVRISSAVRTADGAFTGFTPLALPPTPSSDPANPLNVKSPSQMAQELLDATDEFSESLKRFKDSVEGRMAEIDEKIKKL